MGVSESKSSRAEPVRKPNLHVLLNSSVEEQLRQAISDFINFFNSQENRLKEIIDQLEKAEAKEQQIRNSTRTGNRLAVVASGFGASVDVAAAVLTGGLSLALPGFVTGVLGTAARQGNHLLQRRRIIRVNKSVKSLGEELNEMVTGVKEILQNILIALDQNLDKLTYEPEKKLGLMNLKIDLIEAKTWIEFLSSLLPSLDSDNKNIKGVREYLDKLLQFRPKCQQSLDRIEQLHTIH